MYEIDKFMVYKLTVYCLVHSKLLLQVTSLQYIVYWNFFVTSH